MALVVAMMVPLPKTKTKIPAVILPVETHAGSDSLVEELFRAYKVVCFTGDTVLQRLSEVRMRGRKRECFG